MKTDRFRIIPVMISCMILFGGCSTISKKVHAIGHPPPLCERGLNQALIAVYWGTAWRNDQKEVSTRERYVEEGIKTFFSGQQCFHTVLLSKEVMGRDALLATDAELISGGNSIGAGYVIRLRIEELGPNLYLYLSPILWETKNEVLLQARVLDANRGSLESDISIRWMRGGPFTFNGAGSLPSDFRNTLHSIFDSEEGI